jgi:RNA polymerase sigma-70 factor, ECF subfamily
MTNSPPREVTQLLIDWSGGDQAAFDKLVPLVYEELRRLAHHYMSREHVGHTLQTTALVNEAYLRLVDQNRVRWQNRAHFFAIAAQMMRRILVDYARKRRYAKRGGELLKVSLAEAGGLSDERAAEVAALDEALKSLAEIDPQQTRVVELRFFGGLTIEETAEVMGLSRDMVNREWATAKAWLYQEMTRVSGDDV